MAADNTDDPLARTRTYDPLARTRTDDPLACRAAGMDDQRFNRFLVSPRAPRKVGQLASARELRKAPRPGRVCRQRSSPTRLPTRWPAADCRRTWLMRIDRRVFRLHLIAERLILARDSVLRRLLQFRGHRLALTTAIVAVRACLSRPDDLVCLTRTEDTRT